MSEIGNDPNEYKKDPYPTCPMISHFFLPLEISPTSKLSAIRDVPDINSGDPDPELMASLQTPIAWDKGKLSFSRFL
jgi:hypothetical protein